MIKANIGTDDGYTQELCIEAMNYPGQKLLFPYTLVQTANPCLTALAKVGSPVTTKTYAYKYTLRGDTDTTAWGAQLTNSQESNTDCPVVYKVFAKDCAAAPPGSFRLPDGTDKITFFIGTHEGYTQDLCIEASNGHQKINF